MGLIHIELFATLDLVGQAPGGPTRTQWGSPSAGGRHPCWTMSPGRRSVPPTRARMPSCSAGGRMTFSPPTGRTRRAGEDNEIGTLFNSVPKYVASRGGPDLSWARSTQLGPDLAGAVREIRDRHEHVKVVGSLNLVQTPPAREALRRPALGRRFGGQLAAVQVSSRGSVGQRSEAQAGQLSNGIGGGGSERPWSSSVVGGVNRALNRS
jgi:hypothetical protein